MTAAGTLYSVRFPYPQIYVAGRNNKDVLEVERNGQRQLPSAVAYTLYKPDQTSAYAATPTPASGTRLTEVTVPSANLPVATVSFGTGWLARWVCTMPDGQEYTWDREAIVARRALFPTCGQADLLEEYPDLLAWLGTQGSATSVQSWLDSAWKDIVQELAQQGAYGHIACSADAFRRNHRHRALAAMFRWLHTRQPTALEWSELWRHHESHIERSWPNYRRDLDQDGFPDGDSRASQSAVVHFNAAPRQRRRRRWAV